MSANIDTMLYVGEVPWHGLGTSYKTPPKSSEEIIKGAKLDWKVGAVPMMSEIDEDKGYEQVENYHAIYRQDDNRILGVINRNPNRIHLVQNSEMFSSVDKMIDEFIDVETAASLGNGEKVFGCFKIREQYKIFDDDIDHYFVIFNEHLKADGKITVMNTPVRVVCENTLSHALSSNYLKMRLPAVDDAVTASLVNSKLRESVKDSAENLRKKSEKLFKQKIDKAYIDKLLDELFPYIQTDGTESSHDRANEKVSIVRETFINSCLGADNLNNYRGTAYQVFNALTDFTQHYHTSIEKAYDLDARMALLPGSGVDSQSRLVTKFLQYNKKVA